MKIEKYVLELAKSQETKAIMECIEMRMEVENWTMCADNYFKIFFQTRREKAVN